MPPPVARGHGHSCALEPWLHSSATNRCEGRKAEVRCTEQERLLLISNAHSPVPRTSKVFELRDKYLEIVMDLLLSHLLPKVVHGLTGFLQAGRKRLFILTLHDWRRVGERCL